MDPTHGSAFILKLSIPLQIQLGGQRLTREDFYSWLWDEFTAHGLQGVHEGTLLCEEAAEAGLETESWTVDSGEAPRERDWMGSQPVADAELYFATEADAQHASARLGEIKELTLSPIREQENEDWDAQWKASFLGNGQGVKIEPFWRVLPPWASAEEAGLQPGERVLRINPGAGFGTGTHETTQLCLEAIGQASLRMPLSGARALDFGSGSGILSIGAALVGARVLGVEIDPLAIDNAVENAALNGVQGQIEYSKFLAAAEGRYPLVIANILKPVLLEFASQLVGKLETAGAGGAWAGSTLVLSGLIDRDVADVSAAFSALLGGLQPAVKERGEWRALVWVLRG
jgi:ribosomal protein L11 methyltransferase